MSTMSTTSADGTRITFDCVGQGPTLLLLGGPPTAGRDANRAVVEALAPHFTVVNFDRRGRGDSGDAPSYSPDREYEDLAAVLAAVDGPTCAYGTSAGAMFALEAVARGFPLIKLVLWEPPYIIQGARERPPADFADQLAGLIAAGRPGDAVERFFTVAIGLPDEFVAGMRRSPFWAPMEAAAGTLVYDAVMVGDYSLPADRLSTIAIPVLVADGGSASQPWLREAAAAVVDAVPGAQHQVIEGQPHNVAPEAIAPVVIDFLGARV